MTKAAARKRLVPEPFRHSVADATIFELTRKIKEWRAFLPNAPECDRDAIRDDIRKAELEIGWRQHLATKEVA